MILLVLVGRYKCLSYNSSLFGSKLFSYTKKKKTRDQRIAFSIVNSSSALIPLKVVAFNNQSNRKKKSVVIKSYRSCFFDQTWYKSTPFVSQSIGLFLKKKKKYKTPCIGFFFFFFKSYLLLVLPICTVCMHISTCSSICFFFFFYCLLVRTNMGFRSTKHQSFLGGYIKPIFHSTCLIY